MRTMLLEMEEHAQYPNTCKKCKAQLTNFRLNVDLLKTI